MKAIPVEVKDVITILNLPADMADNPIFSEHEALVMRRMAEITIDDDYNVAVEDDLNEDDPLYVAFRYSYAFLLLESVAEFLNLKTLGEGIVKSIGLDSSTTELLTGAEIEAFKAKLELRALTLLKGFLNEEGIARMYELKPRVARLIRIGVI
jgi:hypothetical protein